MTELRVILDKGLRPGVYRWSSGLGTDEAEREVAEAGWDFVLLDTTGVHDKTGFMDVCATAFDLPRWFGRNWDALADSLADRSTGEPEVVLWIGLYDLLDHDHDTVDVALQIFAEDATGTGQLRVLIQEPAGVEAAPDLLADVPVL